MELRGQNRFQILRLNSGYSRLAGDNDRKGVTQLFVLLYSGWEHYVVLHVIGHYFEGLQANDALGLG